MSLENLGCKLKASVSASNPGGHCHGRLYQMRENRPQISTLNEDFMVDQKIPLTSHTGQISHRNTAGGIILLNSQRKEYIYCMIVYFFGLLFSVMLLYVSIGQ